MKKVRQIFKYVIIITITFLFLTTASMAVFIYLYPKDRVRSILTKAATSSLKRHVTIKNLNYSFKGVILNEVVLYDGEDINSPVFLKVKHVGLSFSVISLIRSKLEIYKIYLQEPELHITFNKEKKSNVELLLNDLSSGKGESSLETKISKMVIEKATIHCKNLPKYLKPLEGTHKGTCYIRMKEKNKITFNESTIYVHKNKAVLYPDLVLLLKKNDFELKGDVKVKYLLLDWIYKWGVKGLPYKKASGVVKNLKITKKVVEGFPEVTSTLVNYKHLMIGKGFFRVNIPKKFVYLANLKGSIRTSTFTLQNLLFTFKGHLQSFHVSAVDAFFSDLRPILKNLPQKLYGKVKGKISYINNAYHGVIRIINGGFDARNKILSNLNTQITINNNLFKKENILLKLYGSPALISIASTQKDLKKIILHIKAKEITIKPQTQKQSGSSAMSFPIPINCMVNIKKFTYDIYPLENVYLYSLLKGPLININKISIGFAGGSINGKGTIFLQQRTPKAHLLVQYSNIRVQSITKMTKKFQNRVFGFLNGKANLNLEVGPKMLDTMQGSLILNVVKGKISNTGIQSGLGIFLSELKYKLKDLEFNNIYGNFDINGHKYRINSFIFNSQNIKLNLKGKLVKKLIAEPLFITVEFNNYFIGDLATPAVLLTLNQYKKGGWYIIPFKMMGDVRKSKNLKQL